MNRDRCPSCAASFDHVERLTSENAELRAELESVRFKAKAWDQLWAACEQWNDATAHRELEGKGRTIESLLDYAKQNKELRAEVERLTRDNTEARGQVSAYQSVLYAKDCDLAQLREDRRVLAEEAGALRILAMEVRDFLGQHDARGKKPRVDIEALRHVAHRTERYIKATDASGALGRAT